MKFLLIQLFVLLFTIDLSESSRLKSQARLHLKMKTHLKANLKKNIQRTFQKRSVFDFLNKSYAFYNLMSTFRFAETQIQTQNDFSHNTKIGKGPVYKKGWLKYVTLTKNTEHINEFFINPTFGEEQKFCNHDNAQDDSGPLEIPSPLDFYFVLKKDALYVTSSRLKDIAQQTDVLQIKNLKPVYEGKYEGGIESLGAYKEGACFKLIEQSEDSWVVCGDDIGNIQEWMRFIAVLRLDEETPTEEAKVEEECAQNNKVPIDSINGHWKILKDWNDCSLACGGGIQTMQRVCIPPKEGGLPCEGQAIETRPCNEQPCDEPGEESDSDDMDVVFTFEKVSERPQRYETCIIFEADVFLNRTDLDLECKEAPLIPARAVMNNKTYSIFLGDSMDDIYFSANLEDLNVQEEPDNLQSCYILRDVEQDHQVQVCGKAGQRSTAAQEKQEWLDEIEFFKTKCIPDQETSVEDDPLIQMKLQQLNQYRQGEKELEEANCEEIEEAIPKIGPIKDYTMGALEAECKYEKLAEQEEILEEQKEDNDMRLKLEEEKEKNECIKREFAKKEAKLKVDVEKDEGEDECEFLREEIKNLIVQKRAQKALQLAAMKKQHQRKRKDQENKLNELKAEMAANMLKASKLGDASLCNPKNQTEAGMNNYCDKNFWDQIDTNMECKDPDQFCSICCENEIGEYHTDEREDCLDMCSHPDKKDDTGTWYWVPGGKKGAVVGDDVEEGPAV